MPTQICSTGTLAACTGENWIYAYTADDERILEYRIGGGAFRTSLRDLSGKILREYRLEAASNWSSFEDFIYRDSTLLASVHPTEGTRWFGPDHLGTPRAVFNSAGSVIGLHTYYPFGEEDLLLRHAHRLHGRDLDLRLHRRRRAHPRVPHRRGSVPDVSA